MSATQPPCRGSVHYFGPPTGLHGGQVCTCGERYGEMIAASRPGRKPRDMSPAAKRKRARYAARVLAHVCVEHSDHTAGTGVRCAACRDNGVAARRRLIAYRLQNQLCRECGGPRGPDGTRCVKCRRRRRQRPSRQHAYRIKFERGYARRSER